MSFVLSELPYSSSALEPVMSTQTVELHHDKHHAAYVAKLNRLVAGSPLEKLDLETLIRRTARQSKHREIYNQAAQVWNHDFFWKSLSPNGGGTPPEPLLKKIESRFQSLEAFREKFVHAATEHFGSGWVWLIARNGKLDIVATHDAETPLATDTQPLMVCDIWEHAYYLDYQNRRAEFVDALMMRLANWNFAATQLETHDHHIHESSRNARA